MQNDGGPAFPVQDANRMGHTYCVAAGMSLRDWFAGQALAGLVQNPHGDTIDPPEGYPVHAARVAYEYADAMLVARGS